MKSQLIILFLSMSFTFYAMDAMTRDENNTICLLNALTYAQHKKDNEIVIFQYTKNSDQKNVQWHDGEKSLKNLQGQLEKCCADTITNICFKSCLEDNIIAEKGKIIVYLSHLKFPLNHNDNDSWSLKKYFDTLKQNQATTPFMIATDNDITARDLGNYLERQYPDDVIIYFPEKRSNFFTQPFVIAGGIVVALLGWYLLKHGY